MIGTIKTVDLRSFWGLTLLKVELEEYVLKLHFGEQDRIDIEEYWECLDAQGKLIDRMLSSKFRKKFRLPELVGAKLISIDYILETFHFNFDNKHVFKVSAPDFEHRSLKQHKAFGDGGVDRPPAGFGI